MSDGKKAAYDELEDDIYRKRLQKLTDMGKGKLLDIFSYLETEIRILDGEGLVMTYRQHMRFKRIYDLIKDLP